MEGKQLERVAMITTSYFASKAPAERKVCIAKKYPRFMKKGNLWIKELAPSNPFVSDWEEAYLFDLETRFPGGKGLVLLLEEIRSQVPEPILCCYEKERSECHRSILSNYVKKHIGLNILEWSPSVK